MDTAKEITIKYYWTDEIDDKTINDFCSLHNTVFKSSFNRYRFIRKYSKNIYGPSIIVLAYIDRTCIGARAFWRNDIVGIKSYQPCDTGVLSSHRGYGVFKKMTKKALEELESKVIIYNFPNENSYPGYLNMGWNLQDKKKYKFFFRKVDSDKVDKIDNSYMDWILEESDKDFNSSLHYSLIGSRYYLVARKKYNLYVIIGEISKEKAKQLKKSLFPIHLCYSKHGYLGRGLYTVRKDSQRDIYIPPYKMDTMF